MSVALLLTDVQIEGGKSLLPVATQESFRDRWLPGAAKLGLDWVALMETGFDVTSENRDELVAQLAKLRNWMVGELGAGSYEIERLDGLVAALRTVEFRQGVTVFLG